jgi:hypothetical protein
VTGDDQGADNARGECAVSRDAHIMLMALPSLRLPALLRGVSPEVGVA